MIKVYFSDGQALIESVVVIGVVLVLVVGLLAGSTSVLKTSRYGKAKALSVSYAQEAVEVVRGIRNASWTTFSGYAGTTKCLDDTNALSPEPVGGCAINIHNGDFIRSVAFSYPDPLDLTKVEVDVSASWNDGSAHSTNLTTIFTQWRQ